MILLRASVRLLGFLLLVALALGGAAVAIFCVEGGEAGLSVPALGDALRLHELRDTIDSFLDGLERSGGVDLLALLGGLGAIVLGLLLLVGVFVPTRERLVTLGGAETGLASRRRPLAQLARTLAERAEGITQAKVRVRPGRGRGGTVRVRVDHVRTVAPRDARRAVESELAPLTDRFGLKARVRARAGERGARVQ